MENYFEPVEHYGWPPISIWITQHGNSYLVIGIKKLFPFLLGRVVFHPNHLMTTGNQQGNSGNLHLIEYTEYLSFFVDLQGIGRWLGRPIFTPIMKEEEMEANIDELNGWYKGRESINKRDQFLFIFIVDRFPAGWHSKCCLKT